VTTLWEKCFSGVGIRQQENDLWEAGQEAQDREDRLNRHGGKMITPAEWATAGIAVTVIFIIPGLYQARKYLKRTESRFDKTENRLNEIDKRLFTRVISWATIRYSIQRPDTPDKAWREIWNKYFKDENND
jgi:hypothetical protein